MRSPPDAGRPRPLPAGFLGLGARPAGTARSGARLPNGSASRPGHRHLRRCLDPSAAVRLRAPASAETPEDRETLLREAEGRGRALGLADARAEAEARRASDEAAFAARFEAARRRWTETEAEALAAGFSAALRALDSGLTERIARLLVPVLTDALRRRALAELGAALARLLADPHHAAIRVSGPQDLLDALAARLGPLGASVAFAPADLAEVQVSADQTVIETQLGAWTRLLAAAIEEA
ncbi:hypothetical protein [Methylobacterium segetis]|uniref:hypothetical protein n=1 Tax=Methylobacterium segetis TaxID=2488750 RepID=UPI001FE02C66|nr:hypothetical protein [Methylobacterium segetis]